MKVTIDGIEYVPATSVANVDKFLLALALQYHTPETLAEYGTDGLVILVTDPGDRNDGETFQEFAARLANLQVGKP
jgi:hypothetical protein